jgi:hypothetical protein
MKCQQMEIYHLELMGQFYFDSLICINIILLQSQIFIIGYKVTAFFL